ncbi:MAG: SRPBCC family protein, partial [Thermodesulfobacteriota bacterium]
TENYEHLGDVSGYVHDLHAVWERERETRHVYVDPDESWFKVEVEVPAQPALVWDYLADPQLRRHWLRADGMTAKGTDKGRLGIGSEYHCAHGDLVVTQSIVDWKPFDYMTLDVVVSKDQFFRLTTRLTPIEGGTRVSWYFFKQGGSNLIHTLISRWKTSKMQGMLTDAFTQGGTLLLEMIRGDISKGKIAPQVGTQMN